MLGGNRENLVAKLIELGSKLRLLRRINLIHSEHGRLARATQQLRQLQIERHDSFAAIDNLHDARRIFNRNTGLTEDFARYTRLVFRDNSARIHYLKSAAFPFGVAVDAIPRDSRLIRDDRAARAG